jgi:hypothetical protein
LMTAFGVDSRLLADRERPFRRYESAIRARPAIRNHSPCSRVWN